MRQPCDFGDRFTAGIRHGVGQVVGQAAAKQHDVLADHGNAPTQFEQVEFAYIHLPQQYPAGLWIVMALQQVDQRGFTDA
ncbi:hypothetical protein D9M71_800930 [compost metagenome]